MLAPRRPRISPPTPTLARPCLLNSYHGGRTLNLLLANPVKRERRYCIATRKSATRYHVAKAGGSECGRARVRVQWCGRSEGRERRHAPFLRSTVTDEDWARSDSTDLTAPLTVAARARFDPSSVPEPPRSFKLRDP